MYTKKAQIPIIKVIAIIFSVSIFLISWVLILNISIAIDERKINTQMAVKKIIDGNCFSKKYASIEKSKFNEETFKDCYGTNDNILIKIKLDDTTIYSNTKDKFNEQGGKCSQTSTLLCTEMKYPIIYIDENTKKIKEITIQTITK